MLTGHWRLRIHSIAGAVKFTFIAPKRLDTCTEVVEHQALIKFGCSRDRGESSDLIQLLTCSVTQQSGETTALLRNVSRCGSHDV